MSWTDYYRLLDKYNGDIQAATSLEMKEAAEKNGEQAGEALRYAEQRYQQIHRAPR